MSHFAVGQFVMVVIPSRINLAFGKMIDRNNSEIYQNDTLII